MVEHRRAHEDDAALERIKAVAELGHALGVGLEDLGVEVLILAVVHAEQHGGDGGLEARDVIIEAIQRVLGPVAADAGIAELEAKLGVAREEVVLHILRVEALVSDRVADEGDAVTVLQAPALGCWSRARSGLRSCLGRGLGRGCGGFLVFRMTGKGDAQQGR